METKERLQEVFWDVFDNEEIELFEGMTANDLEEWDSLNHVLLIIAVEHKFNVKFKTTEITELKNVGDFISLINKKLTR